jgi:tRNA U34 5-methylaminomethyl-2-thiouridine-forming methyltransferase MnmC
MRYAQGGGLTMRERARREALRLEAADLLTAGMTAEQVAAQLRVMVWDNDTTHRDAQIKALIATRARLTVFYLPAYAPTLNPAEGVWSALKRSLANLAPHRTDALAALVKTRLRRMQYRTDRLLDGFVAETGLTLQPP